MTVQSDINSKVNAPFFESIGKNPRRELIIFLGMTFLITWGLAALFFTAPQIVAAVGGPAGADAYHGWLYYVAVYAPSISALLCLGFLEGRSAYVQLFKAVLAPGKLTQWLLWLAISFAILPIGWLVASAIGHLFGWSWMGTADASILFTVLPLTLFATSYLVVDAGPAGEELGWRGYAMPRLLRLMSPMLAGLVLGAIWAIWHIPAFLASQSAQSSLSFLQFFISLSAQGILLCWIYMRTKGNWILAGLIPHAVINCSAELQGFSVDKWMYALVPLVLAFLVMTDPVMRRAKDAK